jgi:hypothetical protein
MKKLMKHVRSNAVSTKKTRQISRRKRVFPSSIADIFAMTIVTIATTTNAVYAAAADPVTGKLSNLTSMILNIVSGIGMVVLVWGIVSFGMAIKSHDASQRSQGIITMAGGLVIALAPQIATWVLA